MPTFFTFASDGLDSEVFLDEPRFKPDVSTNSSSNFGLLMEREELRLGPTDNMLASGVLLSAVLFVGKISVELLTSSARGTLWSFSSFSIMLLINLYDEPKEQSLTH